MKKKEFFSHYLPPVIVIAASLLVLLPLAVQGFFVSDDGSWMIIRLSAFFQSFREGQFPVRFLGRLNYSYGYPVANFLYPGFLYLGSVIHLLGFSFVNSVKLIFAGSVIAGGLLTFAWLRRYFSSVASVIGSIVFVFAPYLLFDLYRRGSVGEILALAWGAMGLYSIASKKFWLFALSISLVIVSHNSLAVLFLILWAVYSYAVGIWDDIRLWFIVGVGMVMFFWFPALYERKYVVFDATPVSNPADYFITVQNAMLIGLSGVLAALTCAFLPRTHKLKPLFLLLFVVTVFLVAPLSAPLWKFGVLAKLFQFPYRFLSVTVCIAPWLAAYAFENQKKSGRWILAVTFVGIGVWTTVWTFAQIRFVDEPEGYYITNEATTTVHDEYMPKWVSQKPLGRAPERIVFYTGQGSFVPGKITTQSVDTMVKASEDSVVQINTVYYPGWGVTLDGIPVKIDYANKQGVMRIPVAKGTHRLVAGFRETISRFLADVLSVGFVIWYILLCLLNKSGKRSAR